MVNLDSISPGVASRHDAKVLQSTNRCMFTIPLRALLGAIASLWLTTAVAQSETVYIEPVFLWNFWNVQDCGGCSFTDEFLPSLPLAWTNAQSVVNGTRDG